MMKLIDVVQRLKLVNDYDQCRAAMNDAIVEIESLRQQLAKPAPEAQILIDALRNCVDIMDKVFIDSEKTLADVEAHFYAHCQDGNTLLMAYDTKATPDNLGDKDE
jgi:hypothetical protein